MDTRQALALLEWQIELGADEAIENAPVNRYELSPPKPAPAPATIAVTTVPSEAPAVDAVAEAEAAAGAATSLAALQDAMAIYPHCELRRGARNLVLMSRSGARDVLGDDRMAKIRSTAQIMPLTDPYAWVSIKG